MCNELPAVEIFDSTASEVGPTVEGITTGIDCSPGPGAGEPDAICRVTQLGAAEKYRARSEDGRDRDRLTLIPVP